MSSFSDKVQNRLVVEARIKLREKIQEITTRALNCQDRLDGDLYEVLHEDLVVMKDLVTYAERLGESLAELNRSTSGTRSTQ